MTSRAGRPQARRLSDIEPESISWLWIGHIPTAALTMIDGDPAVSKSTLLGDLAARLSSGREMPDGSPSEIGRVLLLAAEDHPGAILRPRLEAAGADAERIVVVGEALPLDRDLDILASLVSEVEPAMVGIDPLGAYLTGQPSRQLADGLAGLARDSGAAILVLRHLRKTGGRALLGGLGGIGVVASARAGFVVARDPEDEGVRILAPTKSNLGPLPAALAYRVVSAAAGVGVVEWLGPVERSADDLTRVPSRDQSAVAEAQEFLLDVLADGPVPVLVIKQAASGALVSIAALRRAKRALGVESTRVGHPGGGGYWAWWLPRHADVALEIAYGTERW